MGIKDGQTRRGPRGRGTIFWSQSRQCYIGRATINGRRIERSAPTQAELVRRLGTAQPPGPDITFAVWAEQHLATLAGRAATLVNYRLAVSHVAPHLGKLRLADITTYRIETMATALVAEGLHPNTVRRIVSEVGAVLAAAVREKIIPANPARGARKPKSLPTPIDPFAPAELAAIITAASSRRGTRIVAVMAATGCRIGEACGLDAPDWNPAAGTLSISKTYTLRHGIGPPKSARGVRTIRLPGEAVPAVAASAGNRRSGPLFVTASGKRIPQQVVSMAWRRLLRRIGLRYRNPHQLRHSVATALISAGVPVGDVAAFLGDRVETVVKTYLHPAGADPAAAMSRLLSPKCSDGRSQDGRKVGASG